MGGEGTEGGRERGGGREGEGEERGRERGREGGTRRNQPRALMSVRDLGSRGLGSAPWLTDLRPASCPLGHGCQYEMNEPRGGLSVSGL